MTTREIAGKQIDFDETGFMTNPKQWDRDIAAELAAEIGITPLTDLHWQVIDFCRQEFLENGDAPNVRRITLMAGIQTKELYQLFPKGPAKKAAYIAGLKKPTGCI